MAHAGRDAARYRCAMAHSRPVVTPATLAAVALWVARTDDEAERFRLLLEFVRAWREDGPGRAELTALAAEPPPCGDARWDALIAALAEHLARSAGLEVPSWTLLPQRFLDRPFFPITHRSVRTAALVASPAAFRRRGVFLDPESLATV